MSMPETASGLQDLSKSNIRKAWSRVHRMTVCVISSDTLRHDGYQSFALRPLSSDGCADGRNGQTRAVTIAGYTVQAAGSVLAWKVIQELALNG